MNKIYFTGCSFTVGTGFEQEKLDPRIYPNLVTDQAFNDAEGGSSNPKIFNRVAKAMIEDTAKIYVVQWSALHRHWVYPAPDQGIYIGCTHQKTDEFSMQYQLRNHDYANIIQLLDSTRILEDIANHHNAKIIFVNGLLSWKNDTQWMYKLVSEAESDHDRFVENLKNNLELVNWNNWINPWYSMSDFSVSNHDFAPLDNHPGPKTQKYIANLVLEKINERL